MNDVVGLEVTLNSGEERPFLTWSRVADPLDPKQLEGLLRGALTGFSVGSRPAEVAICESLQEAAEAKYFFEGFFSLSQERIPYGPQYSAWAADKLDRMREDNEFLSISAVVGDWRRELPWVSWRLRGLHSPRHGWRRLDSAAAQRQATNAPAR